MTYSSTSCRFTTQVDKYPEPPRGEQSLLMPGTPKMLFVAVVSFVFGAVMLISWIPRLFVSRSPVVTGLVVARTPITEWGVPRADFAIKISGTPDIVHAHTQRYLLNKIPAGSIPVFGRSLSASLSVRARREPVMDRSVLLGNVGLPRHHRVLSVVILSGWAADRQRDIQC